LSIDVLVLGCGYTGRAVARLALRQGKRVLGTVRSEARATEARADGIDVVVLPVLDAAIAEHATADTLVVIGFPPDGTTDARLAPALAHAHLVYVSSTGVYGDGHVDDATPLVPTPGNAARLAAEDAWRAAGAAIVRCPGIYGPDRGLHRRVIRGEHRIPGDGSRFTSRIHVDDLTRILLAAQDKPRETFVIGDHEPAPQAEVCAWICAHYGVPFPPSVPLAEVHETLRSDRRVDPSRSLARLGIALTYPTYRDGMR
jgi:nucleoside-diphosphate-sugar epimerase